MIQVSKLLTFAAVFLGGLNPQAPNLYRQQLNPASLPPLQKHSGEIVVLIGYYDYGFEVSEMAPSESTIDKISEPTVWVKLGKGESWKFLGFAFHGELQIEGRLNAVPGARYGHLGACDAELVEAKVQQTPRRLLSVLVALLLALGWIVIVVQRKIRARRFGSVNISSR
ncbi:MAG TPA: hypothetical protein VGO11_14715 [Chthoniobacteraceae bacterium]|jgi:hypothetical protein|nr:hypothetical protein [Chthoniobacteraceae bacterium]